MDKVKMILFILPFGFEILHDELDIWRYPIGLDRTDVITNHVGVGEFSVIPGQS